MSGNSIEIEVDDDSAQRAIEAWEEIVGDGAEDAVRQLAVLAERHMKLEAPKGAGHPNVNLRTTIAAEETDGNPFTMVIKPRKSTQDGWPLHHAIIGEPDTPSYDNVRPPIDPLKQWAAAKLGDASAAWPIQEKIFQEGHTSLPNEFIDRSIESWQNDIQDVADDAVADAFRGVL